MASPFHVATRDGQDFHRSANPHLSLVRETTPGILRTWRRSQAVSFIFGRRPTPSFRHLRSSRHKAARLGRANTPADAPSQGQNTIMRILLIADIHANWPALQAID